LRNATRFTTPHYGIATSRLDEFFATMGIPPDKYLIKTNRL